MKLRKKIIRQSFSLIEVVIALGVISVSLIAIVCLLDVGLRINGQSSGQIQEADIASLLMATARATPTNLPSGFSLPTNLSQPMATKTVQIGVDGNTNSAVLTYNLLYIAGTNATTGPKLAYVYLCLWKPLAAPLPTNDPSAYYEVSSQVALP